MPHDRTALFVVDIQNALAADPDTRIPAADRIRTVGRDILATAREVIDSYRAKGEPSPAIIVFVQHEESPDEGPLVKGSGPWELVFSPRENVAEEIRVAKTTGMLYILTREGHSPMAHMLLCRGHIRVESGSCRQAPRSWHRGHCSVRHPERLLR